MGISLRFILTEKLLNLKNPFRFPKIQNYAASYVHNCSWIEWFGKIYIYTKIFLDYVKSGRFINADDIAHVINPLENESAKIDAARLAIQKRKNFILEKKESFLIETTLASQTILCSIDSAR